MVHVVVDRCGEVIVTSLVTTSERRQADRAYDPGILDLGLVVS